MEIQYLSWLRNRVGKASENIDLPPHVKTLRELTDWMSAQSDVYKTVFSYQGIINASVNGRLIEDWAKSPISKDDKICFFSPLAGG